LKPISQYKKFLEQAMLSSKRRKRGRKEGYDLHESIKEEFGVG
jgi:hypothetical protein